MAAPKPFNLREVRIKYGTTFNTTFTAANNSSWNNSPGTVDKLRTQGPIDLSGLEYQSVEDETVFQQLYAGNAPIPTIRAGNVKFSMLLEGAENDTSANVLATLLSKIMGGVSNPATSRTDTAEANATTNNIVATSHGMVQGQAVLAGVKGDGRGGGEVYVLDAPSDANTMVIMVAAPAAITTGDALVYGTTAYFLETTQAYIDGLVIGQSAEDQLQWIGGMGGFSFENLDPNQAARVTFDLMVGDWQEVPSGERDSLDPSAAMQGNNPATHLGLGMLMLTDTSTSTRATHKIANLSIDPGISYQPIPDPNGVNGIGGFVRVRSQPSMEFDVLLEGGSDPLPGFYDDFAAGTAKQVVAQFGDQAQACAAVDMQQAYFAGAPSRVAVGGLMGVRCKLIAGAATHDYTDSSVALTNSPMRVHFF